MPHDASHVSPRPECPALTLGPQGWQLEGQPITTLAERYGTPTYAYSRRQLRSNFAAFQAAVGDRDVTICYAVKANSNLAVIQQFAQMGAGFDIVSGGELARVIAAGGDPRKVVFSGVGKRREEIVAALQADIACFNVESESELHHLSDIATELGKTARVSLRVNPNVDAGTHPYISTGLKENKFGIAWELTEQTYQLAASLPGLQVVGVDCHIGSQITEISPFLDALDRLLGLIDRLAQAGITIHHLDLGGGLGIQYTDEVPPTPEQMLSSIFGRLDAWVAANPARKALPLMFEFGRALVGNAGIMLTRVEYLKPTPAKNFAVIDAAMNDLIRPALYQSYHGVLEADPSLDRDAQTWDLVGPVCESGDWLARNRALRIAEGDVLVFLSAGAYGMAQASNYNTRPRCAEVLVDGDQVFVVRERETVASLYQNERLV